MRSEMRQQCTAHVRSVVLVGSRYEIASDAFAQVRRKIVLRLLGQCDRDGLVVRLDDYAYGSALVECSSVTGKLTITVRLISSPGCSLSSGESSRCVFTFNAGKA